MQFLTGGYQCRCITSAAGSLAGPNTCLVVNMAPMMAWQYNLRSVAIIPGSHMPPELYPVAHRSLVPIGIRWQFQSSMRWRVLDIPMSSISVSHIGYCGNASVGRRAFVIPCEIRAHPIIRIISKLACATPRFDISIGWRWQVVVPALCISQIIRKIMSSSLLPIMLNGSETAFVP